MCVNAVQQLNVKTKNLRYTYYCTDLLHNETCQSHLDNIAIREGVRDDGRGRPKGRDPKVRFISPKEVSAPYCQAVDCLFAFTVARNLSFRG
jgi:hypothetical protein